MHSLNKHLWALLCATHCAQHGDPEWIRELILGLSWFIVLQERQTSEISVMVVSNLKWLRSPNGWFLIHAGMGIDAGGTREASQMR